MGYGDGLWNWPAIVAMTAGAAMMLLALLTALAVAWVAWRLLRTG